MSRNPEYKDLVGFHPGNYVSEILDDMNITQEEFAHRLGISSKTISKLVNCEERISSGTADKLEKVTGVSIRTWLNLQANYDAKVQEIQNAQANDEIDIAKAIDTKYLKEHHFLENKRYKIQEKIMKLHQILKISNLTQLSKFNPAVSYRRSESQDESKSIIVSNVVLELATNEARNKSDIKYDKEKLKKRLPYIKSLILETPANFYPKLRATLLQCGIVLVAMPNIPGARLNGATKKFKDGSVLLLFTDRNKDADIIWFSIIHELGHIYYEDFHSNRDDEQSYAKKEEKADRFAQDFFIPDDKYREFVAHDDFSSSAVRSFAQRMDVIPGIVIGRIRKDGLVGYQDSELNSLKIKYEVLKEYSPI